jgi:hypothetical protein
MDNNTLLSTRSALFHFSVGPSEESCFLRLTGIFWGLAILIAIKPKTCFAGPRRAKLHIPHVSVLPSQSEQLFVRSFLVDSTVLQYDNVVSIFDRTEPMRNNKHRSIASKSIQCLLHRRFCNRIERGRCFVEDADRRAMGEEKS